MFKFSFLVAVVEIPDEHARLARSPQFVGGPIDPGFAGPEFGGPHHGGFHHGPHHGVPHHGVPYHGTLNKC